MPAQKPHLHWERRARVDRPLAPVMSVITDLESRADHADALAAYRFRDSLLER